MMYSVGERFRIGLFGRSHADCVGCIVEGLPKDVPIDIGRIRHAMDLRRPKDIGTPRKEKDEFIMESGIRNGVSTGQPILITVPNKDVRSSDYSEFRNTPRPGHADYPALMKFPDFDIAGGGQFSGRMTAPLVAAGSIAAQYLGTKGIRIAAYARCIGNVTDAKERSFDEIARSEDFVTRGADASTDERMASCIRDASENGDSVGGIVRCMATGLEAGFGGIWFNALDSVLARMMFSIPAVKGVEFGKGFALASMKGSESNDQYRMAGGKVSSDTNNMGGICGGMSNGMPLVFDVAFKPTPSIAKEQHTVDLRTMEDTVIKIEGRHDPCIVPRAVSVVEAMAAIAIADQELTFG